MISTKFGELVLLRNHCIVALDTLFDVSEAEIFGMFHVRKSFLFLISMVYGVMKNKTKKI